MRNAWGSIPIQKQVQASTDSNKTFCLLPFSAKDYAVNVFKIFTLPWITSDYSDPLIHTHAHLMLTIIH